MAKPKGIPEGAVVIRKVAEFNCAHPENVRNIAMALAQAGRFVNVINTSSGHMVYVYERV